MPTINHLVRHFKQYGFNHKLLYTFSFLIFFFAIFDSILTFIVPIAITNAGISETTMGLIIGTSSMFGAVFDFVLCMFLKKSSYRRILILMFILAALFPFLLWEGRSVAIFILAMAVWGFYYDLLGISTLDFVGREMKKEEHVSSFGVVGAFSALGYLLGPLIAGILIVETIGFNCYSVALMFLALSFVFYIFISRSSSRKELLSSARTHKKKHATSLEELKAWFDLSKKIFPILIFITTLNVIDATFWTLGPLLSSSVDGIGSLFLILYQLPALLIGWFVGSVTMREGEKRTAFVSLFAGSLLIFSFSLIENRILLLATSFLASFCLSFAWPSIKGIIADFISTTKDKKKELETLQDYFANLGYVIGPIFAGFFGERIGDLETFSLLGFSVAVLTVILAFFHGRGK